MTDKTKTGIGGIQGVYGVGAGQHVFPMAGTARFGVDKERVPEGPGQGKSGQIVAL